MEFARLLPIIGEEKFNSLQSKKILILGIGGVGGACCEALVRSGIKRIAILDNDIVDISNINRQIIALHSTIGQPKTNVMKARLLDINPNCEVEVFNFFFTEETSNVLQFEEYDYIVDCIDTVSAKIFLAKYCYEHRLRLISSMGTGNKIDPTKLYITDLFKTTNDPLARVMRYELKKRGIPKLTVLCSTEVPIKIDYDKYPTLKNEYKNSPASVSFVPPVAGMIIASYVIQELCK